MASRHPALTTAQTTRKDLDTLAPGSPAACCSGRRATISPSLLADAIGVADPALLTAWLRNQPSGSKESGESFWVSSLSTSVSV